MPAKQTNVYEGMFILDPSKYSRDPAATSQQIADMIMQNGGTVLASRLWDERKLAYPINGHKKGIYWLTYFKMAGDGITPLERQCEITDDVIRKLILKVDPRIADALVQHALAGDTSKRTGRAKAAVREELRIGELPEDVRAVARETPVSNNKRELLALTRMPQEEQRRAVAAVKSGESKTVRISQAFRRFALSSSASVGPLVARSQSSSRISRVTTEVRACCTPAMKSRMPSSS